MNFDKYTHIENLSRAEEILCNDVIVTEKLHGTNVRFAWLINNDGIATLHIGSRNNLIYSFDSDKYNKKFDGYGFRHWFHYEENALRNIWDRPVWDKKSLWDKIFYGEFIGSGIQKGIKYFPENKKDFVLFDIKDMESGKYLDYDEFISMANQFNFKTAPLLHRGKLTLEKANELINCESAFAKVNGVDGQITEGIVIKPVNEVRDKRNNRLIAKYKSDVFKESKKIPRESKPVDEFFIAGKELCTEARVVNVIDKLRQETNEELSLRHIPLLMQLYNQDVMVDVGIDLPDDKKERKQFMKGAACNVVGFYKDWLRK